MTVSKHSQSIEDALARITDGSPVATFVLDKNHRVIHWNKAIEALTGIKREEVIGTRDHHRAFHNNSKRILADLILDGASCEEIEIRYEGKSRRSLLIEGAYEAEDFFPVPNSTAGKWLHFTASPLKDKDGNIFGAIETLEDITERKNAEAALRDSEANYRNLFESALDAIWANDIEGNIYKANESAARLTGYSIEKLCQSNISLFLSQTSLDEFNRVKAGLLAGQPLQTSYELTIIQAGGSEAICMVTTNRISYTVPTPCFQTIARDVTEEKRTFENKQFYLQEITRAQEEERKRIARELHDSTAQNLIALLHKLENFLDDKTRLPVCQAKQLWGFYEHIRDILQEVRRFSRDLRPSVLDDLGLIPALEWLTEEVRSNYGIDTLLVRTGTLRRLAPEAELLLFRIVQEALTNVVKHAHASKLKLN